MYIWHCCHVYMAGIMCKLSLCVYSILVCIYGIIVIMCLCALLGSSGMVPYWMNIHYSVLCVLCAWVDTV